MKLGIGIDTGGTYTDAVIYDFDSGDILGTAKALTTRNDLKNGILGAIDGLPRELAQQAELISLSTTLATNACVEDKGGRAKLIFFGGDKNVIDKNGRQCGLPPAQEIYLQESYTSFSGGSTREPDWELFDRATQTGFEDLDGVGIIEINAMRNGGVVEKKAKELFTARHDLPVVCGHELSSQLDCLKRGAGTLLNASLFPVIREFLLAVKKALAERGIAPKSLVIVRSDGSLMSEAFASLRPVETLLCGPAASAIGCARLSRDENSIVVDMGGTTTDLAFIQNNRPVTVKGGISIGKWKTFVSGLYVKTFGLGGDSAVHYRDGSLALEEYRVVPLCVAAAEHPIIKENLRRLEKRKHTRFLYEHYLLVKDVTGSTRYNEEEHALCRALQNGPLLISDAAAAVGRDIYTLQTDRLLKDGVIQLCGLTPTDIMHLRGDFAQYDTEAARLGAEFAAFNLGCTVEELCALVYEEIRRKLYVNIVKALLEVQSPLYMKNSVNEDVERFILQSYEAAKTGRRDPLLSAAFHTSYTLVGAGAPIAVFLQDVAALLGTKASIPPHHEVANALGAVMGSVRVASSAEIKPVDNAPEGAGFLLYGPRGRRFFPELEEALAAAKEDTAEAVRAEALRRGAAGEIDVTVEVFDNSVAAREVTVHLGTVVTATAAGTLGFA